MSAEELINRKIVAVLNCSRSITGRYPNLGPQLLLDAGIPVIDDCGTDVLARVTDGATVRLDNDTLYLGTPFYRIFALEPDTGKIKWTYDTKAALEALTQPDLKNRGVAYWQTEAIIGGQACQKHRDS